jgi:hypothetical protein
VTPTFGQMVPMPDVDQKAYEQLIKNMPKYLQVWQSNVKDGNMYTYALRRDDMQLYFSYNEDDGRAILSIIRLVGRDGRLGAIAVLHLTDEDLDGRPDRALYASYFLGGGGLMTSLNTPSDVPTSNDLQAWNTWMAVMIKYFNDYVEQVNLPENVDPEQ